MGVNNLKAFIQSKQEQFEGVIRIQKAINDTHFPTNVIRLEDYSGYADVFVDQEVTASTASNCLIEGNVIAVNLQRMSVPTNQAPLQLVACNDQFPLEESISALPHSACPKPELLERLVCIHRWLSVSLLRELVYGVLSDDGILLPFLQWPASRRDHHAYPAGLLEHSIEVAERTYAYLYRSQPPKHELELAVVAGLFHDIGKIWSHTQEGQLSSTGLYTCHENLGPLVLGVHLQTLMEQWPEGGGFLVRILASEQPYYIRHKQATSLLEKAVRSSDYSSATSQCYRQALNIRAPQNHRIRLSNGRIFEFVRPPAKPSSF